MIAPRTALLVLAATVMVASPAAEQGRLVVGQVRSSSFRLTLPEGWRRTSAPDPSVIPPLSAARSYVFESFRAVTGATPLWMEGLLYGDKVPILERSEANSTSEIPRADNSSVWQVFENPATVTACTRLVSDVLCIKMRVPDSTLMAQAKSDLSAILDSFTEVPRLP